ncbi:MAG: hypothetical protein A3F11_10715 [Gammaproteobacteria bacterium RIFCSPHIGHO2_12_FULL_37_14]|nr:MAG: hypothetical protein A3F11_10715 [Gammaproteobacteria bacterium RIFCSPHIGHO2_12_FULL_37_14]
MDRSARRTYLATVKKWSLIIILLFLLLSFFYFHLNQYFTLNNFEHYQLTLQKWTATHYIVAVSLYIAIFILLVACAIPGGMLLTFIGGFLFGFSAIIYSVFSTTMGGLILFFAVRTSIGAHIATKSTGWIKKMENGFQQNAFRYLLMLRLIPIFPCWISNIAAGALNVPLKVFIHATILGILPATLFIVLIGNLFDHVSAAKISHLSSVILHPRGHM